MEIDEILKEIGFTEYKAKIYKTLLFLVTATPREIAKEANIPVTKAYQVLEELAKEGFVVVLPGKPITYRALLPSSTILPFLEEKIKKIKLLEEEAKKLEEKLSFKSLPKKEILFFQDWKIIEKVLLQDMNDSKKEILLFLRFGKPSPAILKLLEKKIKSGVKVKVLGPYTKERELHVYQYKKVGCNSKVIKNLNSLPLSRFSIYDGKVVNLSFFSPLRKSVFLVRIEEETTAKLFEMIFSKLWETAQAL
jgi:sugar-specific transcriptional regulator TrmB